MDLSKYDYSVFYDGIGITIEWAGRYDNSGRVGWKLSLWKDGNLIHTTEMFAWANHGRKQLIGSAVGFMTDYNVCESEGIVSKWYDDPRIEFLGYLGTDIEETDEDNSEGANHVDAATYYK